MVGTADWVQPTPEPWAHSLTAAAGAAIVTVAHPFTAGAAAGATRTDGATVDLC